MNSTNNNTYINLSIPVDSSYNINCTYRPKPTNLSTIPLPNTTIIQLNNTLQSENKKKEEIQRLIDATEIIYSIDEPSIRKNKFISWSMGL